MTYPYQAYSSPGGPKYADRGAYQLAKGGYHFVDTFTYPNGPLTGQGGWLTLPDDGAVTHLIASDLAVPDPTHAVSGNYRTVPVTPAEGYTVSASVDYSAVGSGYFARIMGARDQALEPTDIAWVCIQVDGSDWSMVYLDTPSSTNVTLQAATPIGSGPPATFDLSLYILDASHVQGGIAWDGHPEVKSLVFDLTGHGGIPLVGQTVAFESLGGVASTLQYSSFAVDQL